MSLTVYPSNPEKVGDYREKNTKTFTGSPLKGTKMVPKKSLSRLLVKKPSRERKKQKEPGEGTGWEGDFYRTSASIPLDAKEIVAQFARTAFRLR